jgi:hypothetical protein
LVAVESNTEKRHEKTMRVAEYNGVTFGKRIVLFVATPEFEQPTKRPAEIRSAALL